MNKKYIKTIELASNIDWCDTPTELDVIFTEEALLKLREYAGKLFEFDEEQDIHFYHVVTYDPIPGFEFNMMYDDYDTETKKDVPTPWEDIIDPVIKFDWGRFTIDSKSITFIKCNKYNGDEEVFGSFYFDEPLESFNEYKEESNDER